MPLYENEVMYVILKQLADQAGTVTSLEFNEVDRK